MRTYPDDSYDFEEIKKLEAPDWMVEQLRFNPDYPHWGPHEDYMWKDGEGWDSAVIREDWESGKLELNDLNEVVNFYFSIERDRKDCEACDGSGLNPATKQISDDFYDFAGTGQRWSDAITQDEVDALIAANRLWDFWRRVGENGWEDIEPRPVVTADMVNKWGRGRGLGHDAINRWILIETRAKRLGVYGHCEICKGDGYLFTVPAPRLALVLWVLHPRKGCSRGWEIKNIQREELPEVYAYLKQAAQRNTERFAKIPA